MGEFYGSLQDIGLPEILSFLKGLGKTGSLRISQGRWVGDVSLSGGRVNAASFHRDQGVSALEAMMLGLAGGSFTFTDGSPSAEPNIDLEPDALHAHLSTFDAERASLAAIIPSLSAVPRVAKAPSTTGEVVLDGASIETLLAVNGENTVGEIARDHGLVQTARELARLVQNGLITIDMPEGEPAAARSEPGGVVAPAAEPADAPPAAIPTPPALASSPAAPEPDVLPLAQPAVAPLGRRGEADGAPSPAANGEAAEQQTPAPAASEAEEFAAAGPCPKLGYVDDPANRYSRPTQLHRCFASGTAERVSTPEQRELCLTNRYPTCPRFIAAGATATPAAPVQRAAAPEVARQPVETGAGRGGRLRAPVPRESSNGNGGVADSVAPRSAGGPAVARPVPPIGRPITRPEPPPRREPTPVAAATTEAARPAAADVASAEEAARPEPRVRQIAENARVQAPSTTSRKLVPAVLLVTAAAVATLAVVMIRAANNQIPEVTEADVARLATAVANNPSSAPPGPADTGPAPAPGPAMRNAIDVRFADEPTGWPNNPAATAWFADGEYHVSARTPGQFVAIGAPGTDRLGDMVASATFRKVGGPVGGGYGFIIRDQGPGPRDGVNQIGQYYVLEVGDRGEYGIWRREGDRWLDLIPWTPSDLVPQGGATNEVTVQATGQELTFLVNGKVLANLVGAVLRDGGVGIFVGGDLNEVAVERLTVQTPA